MTRELFQLSTWSDDAISRTQKSAVSLFVVATKGTYTKRDTGKRCVAGGPGGVSCGNSQYTLGKSIHHFPDKNKYPERFSKWVRFVRRHRPNWTPESNQAILCGVHFEDSCFTTRRDVAISLGMKIKLKPDAIPTVDAANESKKDEKLPDRAKRQVRWPIVYISYIK